MLNVSQAGPHGSSRKPPYTIGEAVTALRISGLGRGRVSAIAPRTDGGWNVTVLIWNASGKPTPMDYTVSAQGRSDYMDHGRNSPQMFADDRPQLPELDEMRAALRTQE